MALVGSLVPEGRVMLRLILLVLYLIASSTSPQTKQDSGTDPSGLTPPPAHTDGGSGADPLG